MSRGSILILVLWILALLAYLAGDYLAYSREKSAINSNSWVDEKEDQAVKSVIELFSTDRSPLSGQEEETHWVELSPGGIKLWVKVEKEQGRINLNTAIDANIREKIMEIVGDKSEEEVDRLVDAILDWRDPDNLTRLNGAEEGFYENQGLPYVPTNGQFKALTELLLVRGMSAPLFWGDPLAAIRARSEEGEEVSEKPLSISDAFTIFEPNMRRISIVIPRRKQSYELVLIFMKKRGIRWQVKQIYRTVLISAMEGKNPGV